MGSLFSEVLNMSLTASLVILLVLAARLVLRKAPKIYSYALWAVVLFRLLCPVSLPSPVSVLEVTNPQITQTQGITSSISYVPVEYIYAEPETENEVPIQEVQMQEPQQKVTLKPMTVLAYIWTAGAAAMLLRSAASYIGLRRKLVGAVCFRGNVYLADHIPTPFVMGIFRPKIYLPSGIPPKERLYIVSHERHHIRRGDHIIKLLAYAALSIHWFNPLVWVAFIQAGKDMEMSCDEAVIKRFGPQIRVEYSASLLRLSSGQRIIGGTPLAFGEGDTKGRIRNMAKWKKPKLWASILCGIVSIAILAACALNPSGEERGYPVVSMILPDGYDFAIDVNGNTVITIGEQIIGGVYRYEEPNVSLTEANAEAWLRAMGVPEITTGAYDYMLDSSTYSDLTATYANPAGESWHEYFLRDGMVTDVWLDMDFIDGTTRTDILESLRLETASREEKHPTISLDLPAGYTYDTDGEGNVVFTDGETIVGGILCYDRPDMELNVYECEQWLQAMGVPQILEGGYDRMASSGNGTYSHLTVSFYHPQEGETKHEYYIWQNSVTDIWLDTSLSTGDMHTIWDSVRYSDPYVEERDPEDPSEEVAGSAPVTTEELILEKVRTVLETIQSSDSCRIDSEKYNEGGAALNDSSQDTYWKTGADWLTITKIPEGNPNGFSVHAYAQRNGIHYDNEGTRGLDEDGYILWTESSPVEVRVPWLLTFQWNENIVAYMDTQLNNSGECVMLRIDEPYPYGAENADHYFVNVYFDQDGNFLNIRKQVNLFQENAYTEYESLSSLDAETVATEMEGWFNGELSLVGDNSANYQEEFTSMDGTVDFRMSLSMPSAFQYLPVVDVVPDYLTGEEVKQAAYAIFGENAVFYESEPTFTDKMYLSKAEIEAILERYAPYTELEALAELSGSNEGIMPDEEEYLKEITEMVAKFQKEYTEKLAAAPEKNPRKECEWTFKNFSYYTYEPEDPNFTIWHDDAIRARVTVNGIPYVLLSRTQNSDYKENSIQVYISDYDYPAMMSDTSVFRAQLCRTAEPTQAQIAAVQNKVMKILSEIDMGRWQIDKCEVEVLGEEIKEYTIKVYAVPVLYGYPALRQGVTGISNSDADNYVLTDTCFEFSANGDLLSMEFHAPITITSVVDNADILPMDDLLELAKAELEKKTAANYSMYVFPDMDKIEFDCTVTVTNIQFGLNRIRAVGTEDGYRYIPCVRFLGTVECNNAENGFAFARNDGIQTLVVINVMDGSAVPFKYG